MGVKIAPSILSADFTRLGAQVAEVEGAGADYIHVDVMDGHFVPNLTIGPAVVRSLRSCTKLPLDVHLMIENPDRWIQEFADAGADIITVHVEATPHLHRAIESIKKMGIKAGVSLNPSTSPALIEEIIPFVDLVLIMSVNPGFGGQVFIEEICPKIVRVRQMLDEGAYSAELEIDGGINYLTTAKVVEAGARVLVAGSAIYNEKNNAGEAVKRLREVALGVLRAEGG